ncbi:MAG: hypothetical protein CMJ32_03090 [Phycisphaerae bacterium]|nr:hypothetical protein [Phycisphaerae bacterium]
MEIVKTWAREFIDLMLIFIAIGVLVQIIFGTGDTKIPYFGAVVANLMDLIGQFGTNGLVGLIALLVIIGIFAKRTSSTA